MAVGGALRKIGGIALRAGSYLVSLVAVGLWENRVVDWKMETRGWGLSSLFKQPIYLFW